MSSSVVWCQTLSCSSESWVLLFTFCLNGDWEIYIPWYLFPKFIWLPSSGFILSESQSFLSVRWWHSTWCTSLSCVPIWPKQLTFYFHGLAHSSILKVELWPYMFALVPEMFLHFWHCSLICCSALTNLQLSYNFDFEHHLPFRSLSALHSSGH